MLSFRLKASRSFLAHTGAVAAHYKLQPGTFEPHATTLDYLVAAAAG
jgi:hypothetical protein